MGVEGCREEELSFSIAVDDKAGAFLATADGVEFGAVPSWRRAGGWCCSQRRSCRSPEDVASSWR
jgi:hypothetical protein